MTFPIQLPAELFTALEKAAEDAGENVNTFAAQILTAVLADDELARKFIDQD